MAQRLIWIVYISFFDVQLFFCLYEGGHITAQNSHMNRVHTHKKYLSDMLQIKKKTQSVRFIQMFN